jgi:hypothetical protein
MVISAGALGLLGLDTPQPDVDLSGYSSSHGDLNHGEYYWIQKLQVLPLGSRNSGFNASSVASP